MKRETIQGTLIYKELEKNDAKYWFSFTRSKFISHVDTFYYSVKTAGEWGRTLGAQALVNTLKTARETADEERKDQPFSLGKYSDLLIRPYFGFHMYKYGISKPDCFDIFVASKVPNQETSPIFVQLRSQFIWLRGLRAAYEESRDYLMALASQYDIRILDITENRLDFAYHTNYIQNMLLFFKDENLGQMQVSSFKRWGKEGCFLGDDIYNDYISLGRRKSDNAFVRIYNKSKEVIELGYKQFFVPIWQDQGLISAFDRYIFDYIFDSGSCSWNFKEEARCRFYLEYGSDQALKNQIKSLLEKESASVLELKKLADSCVPDLTDVVNIEIQIKRKFTKSIVFPPIDYPEKLPIYERRIYKLLHMLQSIRDFITHDTIRFVNFRGEFANMRRERRPTADWWLRLSACGELDGIHYDLCRSYQLRYDIERSKRRVVSDMSSLVTLLEYFCREDFSDDFILNNDILDSLSCFNDNDLRRYEQHRIRRKKELSAKFGAPPAADPGDENDEKFTVMDDIGGIFDESNA